MDGFPAQVDVLSEWLRKSEYKAVIVEDCAQAIGAEIGDKKSEPLATLLFSASNKKLLSEGKEVFLLPREGISMKEPYYLAIFKRDHSKK